MFTLGGFSSKLNLDLNKKIEAMSYWMLVHRPSFGETMVLSYIIRNDTLRTETWITRQHIHLIKERIVGAFLSACLLDLLSTDDLHHRI